MDLNMVAKQTGVQDPAVIGKAREYLRLSSIKLSGGLGSGEVCKPAVCLELACSSIGAKERPTRDKFIRFGCTSAKVYQDSYLILQRALQVVPATDLQDIALYLEATQLIEPVRQLLRVYEQRFLASLATGSATSTADIAATAQTGQAAPGTQKQQQQPQRQQGMDQRALNSADFNRPVFAAAAFALLGKARKIKVDAVKLRQRLTLTAADYNTTLNSMAALCPDLISSSKGSSQASKCKRGKEEQEEREEKGEEQVDGAPAGKGGHKEQARGVGQHRGESGAKGRKHRRGVRGQRMQEVEERGVEYEQAKGRDAGLVEAGCPQGDGHAAEGEERWLSINAEDELVHVEEDEQQQDEQGYSGREGSTRVRKRGRGSGRGRQKGRKQL